MAFIALVLLTYFAALVFWTIHYERVAGASGMMIEDHDMVRRAVNVTVPLAVIVEAALVVLIIVAVRRRRAARCAPQQPTTSS